MLVNLMCDNDLPENYRQNQWLPNGKLIGPPPPPQMDAKPFTAP